ncbi:NACHT domain-containing protein [Aerococcaceae bacterium NML190073]|nr:NACHT domain-containing protein [Aerococcaceae bacterium NML190073]
MIFKDFIQRLASVLRAESNTAVFTRTIFESIIPEERYDSLDEYSPSSFKSYYNGSAGIGRISRKINSFADPMIFSAFIDDQEDAAVEKLCTVFKDALPDIHTQNAGDQIAALFSEIITAAAGAKKKSAPKDAKKIEDNPFGAFSNVAPELTAENAGNIFFIDPVLSAELSEDEAGDEEEINPFEKYLYAAAAYYSTKKTLLYAEKPYPFYGMYVCNDIRYRKFRFTGARDFKEEKTISNVTVPLLEAESKYAIIQGIGGIGKSMLLTHLFLSSADSAEIDGTPLLLSLKDYKENTCNIVDFIWKSIKEYDADIAQSDIIDALQNRSLILLMDGLDEIQSSVRDAFDQDLEAFIKSYPGNTIIMTSRPVYSFVSYSKFSLFDIQELTKPQAIELVEKLEFWDESGKQSFLEALDRTLYSSHRQFASNPLLLTIMLMTYSSFGEVPAKMHVFYSKAYETMARLHDASKGSFKRPLHTELTPEEFSKLFAQFCARTYRDEVLEFDFRLFSAYMSKVLNKADKEFQDIAPRYFLLDLTDNLCIMYHEGEKYYFIHRSFQEYFAALHFASEYDAKLDKVGRFFESMKNRSFTDRTFEMLYDMIPEKVERFIFLPYLDRYITRINQNGTDAEYWEFLESMYPVIYYEEGNAGECYFNEAESFLYKQIVNAKSLEASVGIDHHDWPKQIYELPTKTWVSVYNVFLEYSAYNEYPDPNLIPDKILDETSIVVIDELPYKYSDYFGEPDTEGITIEIDICELRKNPHRYSVLRSHMEQPGFPLLEEFRNLKKYYEELKSRTQREEESDDLFDD